MSTEECLTTLTASWDAANQAERERLVRMFHAVKDKRAVILSVEDWRQMRDRLIDWYPRLDEHYLCEVKTPEQIQTFFDLRLEIVLLIGVFVAGGMALVKSAEMTNWIVTAVILELLAIIYPLLTYEVYAIETYPARLRADDTYQLLRIPWPLPIFPIIQTVLLLLVTMVPAAMILQLYLSLMTELLKMGMIVYGREQTITLFMNFLLLLFPVVFIVLQVWFYVGHQIQALWAKEEPVYSYPVYSDFYRVDEPCPVVSETQEQD